MRLSGHSVCRLLPEHTHTHKCAHKQKHTSRQHTGQGEKTRWVIYFVSDVTSRTEASVAGGDRVQRNEALALLAVLRQPVGVQGSEVSIIITVIGLTAIIITIIPRQTGASVHRRMASVAAGRASRACASDQGANQAELPATNWLCCPCENVREEESLGACVCVEVYSFLIHLTAQYHPTTPPPPTTC